MENIKKQPILKLPAKASAWYIASGGLARAIGALSTPIFTRLLTPAEYGLYPLYNTWVGVLTVLVTLELTGGAIYRGFQKYEEKKNEFTTAVLGLLGAIFVAFCSLYFAFYSLFESFIGLNVRVSIFMLSQIFASAVISLYLARARFEYKYKAVALLNILSAISVPLISIFIILLTNLRAEARIYASSATTLIMAIPIVVIIIKGSEKLYSKEIWRYLLGRSIPLLPHYLASALILKASEISINRSHGTEALGQYSIALSIGMILTIATSGLLSALSPWTIRKIREGGIDKIRDLLFGITKILSLISLIILAFAPEILSFLAAEEFRTSLPAVYPLEVAVIFSFLSGVTVSACSYYEKGALTSLPSIAGASVSVLLSFILLPRLDHRLAGVITLICYLVMALLSSLVFKKLSGELPINIKKSILVFFLTAVYAALLFMFRGVLLSRIFLTMPLVPLLLFCARDIWVKIRD